MNSYFLSSSLNFKLWFVSSPFIVKRNSNGGYKVNEETLNEYVQAIRDYCSENICKFGTCDCPFAHPLQECKLYDLPAYWNLEETD